MANRWIKSRSSERLYFLRLQNHCRLWLPPWNFKCLLLRRKVMINLDTVWKSRNIPLATKFCLVKALFFFFGLLLLFPVVVYGCVIWTIKKAKHQELMLLNCDVGGDSWECLGLQRSNQSILKEISPVCSLERLIFKLKLQYFGHVMRRTDSLDKTLMLGKIEGGRRRQWQKMR